MKNDKVGKKFYSRSMPFKTTSFEQSGRNPSDFFKDIRSSGCISPLDATNILAFTKQCPDADIHYRGDYPRVEVEEAIDIAITLMPNVSLAKMVYQEWNSRLWHSDDWKVRRYIEKGDVEAIWCDFVPLIYVGLLSSRQTMVVPRHSVMDILLRKLDYAGIGEPTFKDIFLLSHWWLNDDIVAANFASGRYLVKKWNQGSITTKAFAIGLVGILKSIASRAIHTIVMEDESDLLWAKVSMN